jgi:electron transfer flavoprotein alpha/beta subunit
MFEDARKTAGLEDKFVVEDIAELVARAVALETLQLHDLPQLVRAISEAVADKVAARVDTRLQEFVRTSMEQGAPLRPPRQALAEAQTAPANAAAEESNIGDGEWTASPVVPALFPDYQPPAKSGRRLLVAVKHVTKLADGFQLSADGKQVPVEFHESQMNEFDDVALEQALKTSEKLGGFEIVVVTVGPPSADDTLRKALAKGANRGVRIQPDASVVYDPISVARLIAGVALKEEPDLVFCGVQSSDQANGATGSALARLLGFAGASVVVATEWDGGDTMRITRELEGGLRHDVRLPLPAVLTMQAGANTPRYATMRAIKQAKSKPVVEIDSVGIDADRHHAVQIRSLEFPRAGTATMLTGTPDEVATHILKLISERVGLPV